MIGIAESVDSKGWDGIVTDRVGTLQVPAGLSGWEFGTSKKPSVKADHDYEERKRNAYGLDPAQTTFIFFTPRRWDGARTWQEQKRKEGHFKDVRAYTLDSLMTWLAKAPVTYAALSRKLGYLNDFAEDLAGWWKPWREITHIPLTLPMLLAGREGEIKALLQQLNEAPQIIRIHARETLDVMPFVAASLLHNKEDIVKQQMASRCIVTKSLAAFDFYAIQGAPSILLPTPEALPTIEALQGAKLNGHHVIISVTGGSNSAIRLRRLDTSALFDAFREVGIGTNDASLYIYPLAGSLSSYRRRFSDDPHKPVWATGPEAVLLSRLALLGAWEERDELDRQKVTEFCRVGQADIHALIARLGQQPDSPIEKTQEGYRFKSKEDAWHQLASFSSMEDIESFCRLASEVLLELDPHLDKGFVDRNVDIMHGQRRRYSSTLRKSLADTLSLLAVLHDPRSKQPLYKPGPYVAETVVYEAKKLIEAAFESEHTCKLLAEHFVALSEVAPAFFIEKLQADLEFETPIVGCLFEPRQGFITQDYRAHYLISALHPLTRVSEYASQCLRALALLFEKMPDPDSHPDIGDALVGSFRIFHPEIGLAEAERFKLIQTLMAERPIAGWYIVSKLLPRYHETFTNAPISERGTLYRNWPSTIEEVTWEQVFRAYDQIIELAFEASREDPSKYLAIAEIHWHSLDAERVIGIIRRCAKECKGIPEPQRAAVWEEIRRRVIHSSRRSNADSSLPPEVLTHFIQAEEELRPDDLRYRYRHLFDHAVDFERFDRKEDVMSQLQARRSAAIRQISKRYTGIELLTYAELVEIPHEVGNALALVNIKYNVAQVLLDCPLVSSQVMDALSAYLWTGFNKFGSIWADSVFPINQLDQVEAHRKAKLYAAFPISTWLRDRIDVEDDATRAMFFEHSTQWYPKNDALSWYIDEMIARGLAHRIIDLLEFYKGSRRLPRPSAT